MWWTFNSLASRWFFNTKPMNNFFYIAKLLKLLSVNADPAWLRLQWNVWFLWVNYACSVSNASVTGSSVSIFNSQSNQKDFTVWLILFIHDHILNAVDQGIGKLRFFFLSAPHNCRLTDSTFSVLCVFYRTFMLKTDVDSRQIWLTPHRCEIAIAETLAVDPETACLTHNH